MATRGHIVTEVERLIGRGDSNFRDTVRLFVNQAVREWARQRPWKGLRRRISVTADGSRFTHLPPHVETPVYIFDVSNIAPLMAGGNWDVEFAGSLASQTTGRPLEWQDMGEVSTVTEPAGFVTVKSTSTSDTAQDVVLAGFEAVTEASGTALSLRRSIESISLDGQTPVTATIEFAEIETVGKNADTAGNITVQDAASQTVLATLNPYERRSKLRRIEFMRIPAAGTVFEVLALFRPEELEQDSHAAHPSIDEDFLIWQAAGLSLMSLGERQAGQLYMQKARAIIDQENFRDRTFGDQFNEIRPLRDSYLDEENQVE